MARHVIDQMGRQVALPEGPPQRIVSLVPSITELLHALGLGDRVLGLTKFCVHPPEWRREKRIVGGTKRIHYDRVAALRPDLIIANKEENTKEMVEQLAEQHPVWVSDVPDLAAARQMIADLADLTAAPQAAGLLSAIGEAFAEPLPRLGTAAYLIWRQPWMLAGGGTYIDDMLRWAGFENLFGELPRYPIIEAEAIVARAPDVLLLSSEPFPFGPAHVAEWRRWLPSAKIVLVDGEMFSWYGSRILLAAKYFRQLHQSLAAGC